jgi:hypothetical protein
MNTTDGSSAIAIMSKGRRLISIHFREKLSYNDKITLNAQPCKTNSKERRREVENWFVVARRLRVGIRLRILTFVRV